MRIVLIGQAAFGEAVLKALHERGHEIVGVCAPATPADGRPDPLRVAAEAAGLPVLPTRALRRDEAVIQQYLDLNADLNVMAFVTDIIPERVLFAPQLQTIQYHPSLLPLHRGASAIAWAIIHGDATTGLTIFWPDKGLDTGPILLQKEVPIGPDDTVASLYFNQLFPIGVSAMVEAVDLVVAGNPPRIEQDHAQATYEPILKDEHTWLDLSASAQTTYNLLRGANPAPGANVLYHGAQIKLFDAALLGEDSGQPAGTITRIDDEGVAVALPGATLLVKRVQQPGAGKVKASEWAAAAGVSAGERLEAGPPPA